MTTSSSSENIHTTCESILEIFIRTMGLKIIDQELLEIIEVDIGNKYLIKECPPNRSKDKLTRG